MIELDEACAALKCTVNKLEEELRTGRLPGTKIGREWIIPRQAFFTCLNERAQTEAEERRSKRAAGLGATFPSQGSDDRRKSGRRRPLPAV